MTYPIWSGINAEQINSTEVNGAAPTPLIQVDGFDSSAFPVLIGMHSGLYFEVVRARHEQRAQAVIDETQEFSLPIEKKNPIAPTENRTVGVDRSRKVYP